MEKIDFVILWVNGEDKKWLEERKKYNCNQNGDNSNSRFKDWGLLKYWFRGVEKYATWVNKIYFITYGHLPEWLNTGNSKLVIVNHKDYIPEKYLPTFNSNAIELNVYRIQELSENFVLFNDDTFIINNTKPTDFFKNGKPCSAAALNVHCQVKSNFMHNICNNNVEIINEHFDFKKSFHKHKRIWFNLKNGKNLLRTIALCRCPRYPGFWNDHLPVSYKKSLFKKVWKLEPEILEQTSCNKFRSKYDVNHWLIRAWQLASGEIVNRSPSKYGKVFYIKKENIEKNETIIKYIKGKKGKVVCLNDSGEIAEEYEKLVPKIVMAFETKFPEKSSFEK